MAPRARRPGSTSHTINAARLPQELIDAILDEFDTSPPVKFWNERGSAELKESQMAVKSCALVARTFMRPSQMKLFSAVDLRTSYNITPDSQTRKFSKLISSSPHIAVYVKTLLLSYRPGRSKAVGHILSSLGKLTSLLLHPWSSQSCISDLPLPLRKSFAPALSLSSLQFIEIQRHRFDSASDLQALLCNSLSLKSLTLRAIAFTNPTPVEPPVARSPRIVLNSLRLIELKRVDIEELVKHFATVDITHLHSLHIDDCSITNIVRANPSIREIKIRASAADDLLPEPLEELLPVRNHLRAIHLEAYSPSVILSTIRRHGSLSKLDALKIVTIKTMFHQDNIDQHHAWSLIDIFFDQLLGAELEEVNVSCVWFQDQIAAEELRKLLPALDKKGILRVSLADCRWNFAS